MGIASAVDALSIEYDEFADDASMIPATEAPQSSATSENTLFQQTLPRPISTLDEIQLYLEAHNATVRFSASTGKPSVNFQQMSNYFNKRVRDEHLKAVDKEEAVRRYHYTTPRLLRNFTDLLARRLLARQQLGPEELKAYKLLCKKLRSADIRAFVPPVITTASDHNNISNKRTLVSSPTKQTGRASASKRIHVDLSSDDVDRGADQLNSGMYTSLFFFKNNC